MHILFCLS
ncbi:DNA-dependent RNA polymerase largest subunit [Common midwife toad virus]|uniref:DNA-dependent RNA polymerase largest subunit n=1 Tax=common midwife toad virus-NL TaxID=2849710 RepID=A0A0A0VJ56_9VIRU|nr:DNA-dependent RNA polymerase largest subunit [Common midwife toad virus]AIW68499.1 DNA-dependent RNA polymerase largest subunit [common midwife toad virus-NL]